MLALLGCIIAFWLSDRVGQARPLLVGLACMSFIFALLSADISAKIYLVGMLMFFLLWNFIDIFQLGTLSEIDHSGHYAALAPAFQSVGTALGPALSGWLLGSGWGLSDIMSLDSVTAFVAMLAFVWVFLLHFKREKALCTAR